MKNISFKNFIIAGISTGVTFSILFSVSVFLFLIIIKKTDGVSFLDLLGFNIYGYVFLGIIFGMIAFVFSDSLINKKISKYVLILLMSLSFGWFVQFLIALSGLFYFSPVLYLLFANLYFIDPIIESFFINDMIASLAVSIIIILFIFIFESVVFAYIFNFFINKYSQKLKNVS